MVTVLVFLLFAALGFMSYADAYEDGREDGYGDGYEDGHDVDMENDDE